MIREKTDQESRETDYSVVVMGQGEGVKRKCIRT